MAAHPMGLAPAFEEDPVAWAEDQAERLRARDFDSVDWEHVIEEVESVAVNAELARDSHLRTLLMHLLKWQFQPERRSRSWQVTIGRCRDDIGRIARKSPSLDLLRSRREDPQRVLADEYGSARRLAALETGKPISDVPEVCPYTLEQVLDPDFLPEPPIPDAPMPGAPMPGAEA